MCVIPITSQIPSYVTKANRIPLGSQINLGPRRSIRKPQQIMRPFTSRMEGYVRPMKNGGRALPLHGPKFTKMVPVSKRSNSPHKVVRNEYALVTKNLDLEPIKIKFPTEEKD